MSRSLIQIAPPLMGSVPKDYTGAASVGDYVNMGYCKQLMIVIATGAWAGGTGAVTLEQASDAAGSDTTALAFENHYTKLTALSTAQWTKVATTSNTFTIGTANSLYAIVVDANDLTDGMKYVTCKIASPGSNADLYCVIYIPFELDYAGTAPPSFIA